MYATGLPRTFIRTRYIEVEQAQYRSCQTLLAPWSLAVNYCSFGRSKILSSTTVVADKVVESRRSSPLRFRHADAA
jgi:hypothetical protein